MGEVYNLDCSIEKGFMKQEAFELLYGSPFGGPTEFCLFFEGRFPDLMKLMDKMKIPHKEALPLMMQALEAKIVIDRVAVQLATEFKEDVDFFLISMHDCLLTTQKYVKIVQERLLDGFETELKWRPNSKIEIFN